MPSVTYALSDPLSGGEWAAEGSVTSTPGPTARSPRRWTAAASLLSTIDPGAARRSGAVVGTEVQPGASPAREADAATADIEGDGRDCGASARY